MIIKLKCFHQNDLFSQEEADLNNNGEESKENHRYHWEDELHVKDVDSFEVEENSVYLIKGFGANDAPFEYPISNMRMVKIVSKVGSEVQLAFSEEILINLEIIKIEDVVEINAYLKDNEAFGNPIPGIYIANHSFPNSLLG